jgi:hypothetical protein
MKSKHRSRRKRYKLIVYTPFSKAVTSYESKTAAVAERKRLREAFEKDWRQGKVSFSLEKE